MPATATDRPASPARAPRPPFRWAGCKHRILKAVSEWTPRQFNRLIEPFCGSAALFFSNPTRAVLSDINADVTNTLRSIRDEPRVVHEMMKQLPCNRAGYYEVRARHHVLSDGPERAASFLHLNRHCFNGLYRTNLKGHFNVPWGGDRAAACPNIDAMLAWSGNLQQAEIATEDFSAALARANPADFVYLDPPYATAGARVFREYHPNAVSLIDVCQLREEVDALDSAGVRFTLSYMESSEGRFLAEGFEARTVQVQRSISGFASSRGRATELLIRNWS